MEEKARQEKELISIVVPMYHAADYIAQTLDMVRAQTYADWELILVEDGPGDGSAQAADEYLRVHADSRIRLLRQKENVGAARARNTGVDAAGGRYLAYLDADDVWLPDKLLKELAFLKEKRAGFVFTAYEFGDADAKGTGKIVHVPEMLRYHEALSRTVIFTSTVLFDLTQIPKELVKMPEVKSEDTAAWWRILRNGHIAYGMDEVTTVYRRPANSLSSNKFEAIKRIWALYRRQEGLSVFVSVRCFLGWAFRAVRRRI